MRIDFKETKEKFIEGFKGGKGLFGLKMIEAKGVKFLTGRLEPGASVGMHKHEKDSEEVFVLSGSGKAICDGEPEILKIGSCHFCPKGSYHTIINDGKEDLIFFAVVPEQL